MSKNDFDDFEKDLLDLASNLDNGKEVKKHLRKEGSKLSRRQKSQIKKLVKKKTGNLLKGAKRGKVYKNKGEWTVRAYNSSPHGHLIDKGHRIVDKNGVEKGFKTGVNFLEKAEKDFADDYHADTQNFIDKMLNEHDL